MTVDGVGGDEDYPASAVLDPWRQDGNLDGMIAAMSDSAAKGTLALAARLDASPDTSRAHSRAVISSAPRSGPAAADAQDRRGRALSATRGWTLRLRLPRRSGSSRAPACCAVWGYWSATATSRMRLPRTPTATALQLACNYLADSPERNIGLDDLAAAAGIGKFRLIRLFRERTGLPPHALHIAHRICAARRLLEAGHTIAATAAATGFADQSHLHRHFQRSLGVTPAQYQQRFTGTDETCAGSG